LKRARRNHAGREERRSGYDARANKGISRNDAKMTQRSKQAEARAQDREPRRNTYHENEGKRDISKEADNKNTKRVKYRSTKR
jgi:hypothetical protein